MAKLSNHHHPAVSPFMWVPATVAVLLQAHLPQVPVLCWTGSSRAPELPGKKHLLVRLIHHREKMSPLGYIKHVVWSSRCRQTPGNDRTYITNDDPCYKYMYIKILNRN